MDSRIIKTRKKLHYALMHIMCTKNLNEITVKELSEQASINRTTFYLHFKDVYDVYDSMLEYATESIFNSAKSFGLANIQNNTIGFFNELGKQTEIFPEYTSFLSRSNQSYTFLTKFKLKLIETCEKELISSTTEDVTEKLYNMVIIVSEVVEAYAYWLKRDKDIPLKKLEQIISARLVK